MSDLTFLDDGNPDIIDGLINFSKKTLIFKVIESVKLYQQTPYNIVINPQIQEWLEGQEILNEDQMYIKSLEIEPRNATLAQVEQIK